MLQSETPQETVSRLEHLRQNAAERINSETPEERDERLQVLRQNADKRIESDNNGMID